MAQNRTFEQAAAALLARYDRAAAQLREAMGKPFTVDGCPAVKLVEQAAERVLNVVRDVIALRQVEVKDITLTGNNGPRKSVTLAEAGLSLIPAEVDAP